MINEELLKQLPDLPELEEVELKIISRSIIGLVTIAVIGAFLWFANSLYSRVPHTSDVKEAMLLAGVFGIGSLIYISCRMLFGTYYWMTTAEGLVTRSLIGRRFRAWNQIKKAPKDMALSYPLTASLWQHLRRNGKGDLVKLTYPAISLWDAILNSLPRQMQWTHPRPIRRFQLIWGLATFVLISTSVVSFAASLMHYIDSLLTVLLLEFAVIAYYVGYRQLRRQPDSVRLEGDVLEARFGDKTTIVKLDEIASANWSQQNPGTLDVKHISGCISIPIDTIHDESAMLGLALIRWLRNAPKPILLPIPTALRADSETPVDNSAALIDSCEIRLSAGDKAGAMFLAIPASLGVLAVGIGGALIPTPERVAVTVASIISIWAVSLWGVCSFKMSADRLGFSKGIFWWKKFVPWSSVSEYVVGNLAGKGLQYSTTRRLLKSADGKVLANISPQFGAKEDWTRFTAFVLARLEEVLPPEKIWKPWKAQPWQTPEEEAEI